MTITIEALRDLLEREGRTRDHSNGLGFQAHCPYHEDRNASLSVDPGDKAILVNCHAGCDLKDICAALGLTPADLFYEEKERYTARPSAKPRNTATPPTKSQATPSAAASKTVATPEQQSATVQQFAPSEESPEGCTLEEYAAAKILPMAFLRSLGLRDQTYIKTPAMRIPYFGENGHEVLSTQYRVGLHKAKDGPDLRFRFKSGNKAVPYGQWRLLDARARGSITLVEGASDCHTLWYHGEPALGFPGAGNWKDERDAPLLDGIETIYLVIEPDTGGVAVRKWLERSRIRDRVRLVELPAATKDPSALHVECQADKERFAARWRSALDASVSWVDLSRAEAQERSSRAWAKCATLAKDKDILGTFAKTLAADGVAGEARAAKLLYLSMTSRLLDMPVSVVMKGPSSSGKSYLVERALAYFPPDAFYALSAMSEHALAYSEEPLSHRVLVIYEAAGLADGFATYLLRSLLSEGHVRYETVEKTSEGLRPRLIEREGPTGLILTTTSVRLHPENETRMLSIPTTDTQEQTRAIFEALAAAKRTRADVSQWHALQEWLATTAPEVTIPYADTLAKEVLPLATRLRRDFGMVLRLIGAHALLHQMTRARDEAGRIVATIEDYTVVRDLLADLIAEGVGATVAKTTRETVAGVADLLAKQSQRADNATLTATVSQLAKHLHLDKSTTSRRVSVALEGGYLVNDETRKHHASQLRVGDPLPEDQEVLPSSEKLLDAIAKCCSVASDPEGVERHVSLAADAKEEKRGAGVNGAVDPVYCKNSPTGHHMLGAPGPSGRRYCGKCEYSVLEA